MTEENKNIDPIEKLKEEMRAEYDAKLEKLELSYKTPETRKEDDKAEMKPEVRSAFELLLKENDKSEYRKLLEADKKAEVRAFTGGTENGKYGVPVDWQAGIITELPNENELRKIADVQSTTSDTPVFVKADGITSAWGSGTPTKQVGDGNQFSTSVTWLKTLVALPVDLLRDSAYDILGNLRQLAAEGMGEEELKGMTKTTPNAVEALIPEIVTAGNIETSTQDGGLGATDEDIIKTLNNVIYGLHKKDAKNASWVMPRSVQGIVANVHYKNGGPILQNGKLLGFPVYTNDEMDSAVNTSTGTSQYPIIFGNFKQYAIRDREDINIEVLDQPYRAGGEIGYLFEARLATKVKRASAFKVIEVAKS